MNSPTFGHAIQSALLKKAFARGELDTHTRKLLRQDDLTLDDRIRMEQFAFVLDLKVTRTPLQLISYTATKASKYWNGRMLSSQP